MQCDELIVGRKEVYNGEKFSRPVGLLTGREEIITVILRYSVSTSH
jgi:hypothetical protein